MMENNRIPKNLKSSLTINKKSYQTSPINIVIMQDVNPSNTKYAQQSINQYENQQQQQIVDLPITHKKNLALQVQKYQQDNSRIHSQIPTNQIQQSQRSGHSQSQWNSRQKRCNSIVNVLPQIYKKYLQILDKVANINVLNNNKANIIAQCIQQLSELYRVLMQADIQFNSTIITKLEQNRNRIKMQPNKDKDKDKDKEKQIDQVDWFNVLINITLNIWKLKSQQVLIKNTQDNGNKGSILQIVRNCCIKIISTLNIPINPKNANSNTSYLYIIPASIKNKLILLLIIYAKQQLASGNPHQALKYCDICTYSIITASHNAKPIISEQNKFKLHYLRVKIFNSLKMVKEQLQQIIICEQLAKNANIKGLITKDKYPSKKKQKQEINMNVYQLDDKKSIANDKYQLISKLQKRKNELLNIQKNNNIKIHRQNSQHKQNRSIPQQNQHNYNHNSLHLKNRLKQVRDSLQIKDKNQYNFNKNSRSLKKIRSISTTNFHKINHYYNTNNNINNNNNININPNQNQNQDISKNKNKGRKMYTGEYQDQYHCDQLSEENDEQSNLQTNIMFKKTYKQNFTQFINNKNTNKHPYTIDSMKATLSKFDNIHIQSHEDNGYSMHRSKSGKKCLLSTHTPRNAYGLGSQVKQKYQLKSKKLVKRALNITNKNKQYQKMLLGLQSQSQGYYTVNYSNINTNNNNTNQTYKSVSGYNYMQLLAKRPQSSNKNMKIYKNEQKGKISFNLQNDNQSYNTQLQVVQKNNQQRYIQNEQNNCLKDPKHPKQPKLNQIIIQQCINFIQKQILDKYQLKISSRQADRKKQQQRIYSQSNLQPDVTECSSINSVQSQIRSQQIIQLSKNKDKQQKQLQFQHLNTKQAKYLHNFDEQPTLQFNQQVLSIKIDNIIFPGLGKCDTIKLLIKKIRYSPEQRPDNNISYSKQSNKNLQHIQRRFFCIMKINIVSLLGIFCFVHRISDNVMMNMTISQVIKRKIKAKLLSIRVNAQQIKTEEELSDKKQQILLKKRILQYIKRNIVISNKGLGLHLQFKKDDKKKYQHNNHLTYSIKYNKVENNQDIFKRMCSFSQIYEQDKKSLPSLFSKANRNSYNRVTTAKIVQNTQIPQNGFEDQFGIMQKLKVLYIAIQKKSRSKNKKNKKIKNTKKYAPKQKGNVITQAEYQKNLINKQQIIKQNINKQNQFVQDQKVQDNQIQKISKNCNHRNSIGNLLVPVVRYILMGQTSKPKHKLKTIIIKASQNGQLIQNQADNSSNQSNDDLGKHRHHKCSRYGLLTKYIDDQTAIKIKPISTNVYEQTIGKFFMEIGKRKSKMKLKSFASNFPEDVMLSLKCYLMICKQNHRTQLNRQQLYSLAGKNNKKDIKISSTILASSTMVIPSSEPTNVIDRFFEKYKYSFIVRLKKNYQLIQNLQNYIITVTFYRVKKLYRPGYQKFYMLKYQISNRNARTRMDQFIMTSFDIRQHFPLLQIDFTEQYEQKPTLNSNINCNNFHRQQQRASKAQIQSKRIPEISLKIPAMADINIENQTDQEQNSSIDTSKKQQSSHNTNKQKQITKIDDIPIKQQQYRGANSIGFKYHKMKKNRQQHNSYSIQDHKPHQQMNKHEPISANLISRFFHKSSNNIYPISSNSNTNYNINMQQPVEINSINMPTHKSTNSITNTLQPSINNYNRLSCPDNTQIKYLTQNFMNNIDIGNHSQNVKGNNNRSENLQVELPIASNMHEQNQQIQKDSIIENNSSTHIRNNSNTNTHNNSIQNSSSISTNKYRKQKRQQSNINKIKAHISTKDAIITNTNNNQNRIYSTNIAQALKIICSNILIFKSQLYTSIGIVSNQLNTNVSSSNNISMHNNTTNTYGNNVLYYANKFRFSRNKLKQFSGQFLSPHLKSLQIIFQKTIKIQCDCIFAVLTVLKVQNTSQFYIKIYIPQTQKIMSFSVDYRVFEYFSKEQLVRIFHPYIIFDYKTKKQQQKPTNTLQQTNKKQQNIKQDISKISNCSHNGRKIKNQKQTNFMQWSSSNGKETIHLSKLNSKLQQQELIKKQQEQKDKNLQIKYMVDNIYMYFNDKFIINRCLSSNSSNSNNNCPVNNPIQDNIPSQNIAQKISIVNINQLQNQSSHQSNNIVSADLIIRNQTKKPSIFKNQNILTESQTKNFHNCIIQNKDSTKVIWSRILKFIKFQRRLSSINNCNLYEGDDNIKSYLIAKIGQYQAFIKDFSVQQHIILNNCSNQNTILKKLDGLNFSQRTKHHRLLKINTKKHNKPKPKKQANSNNINTPIRICKPSQKNIYESQSNKHIIYITITQTQTQQKICFSYYLCELLHLIDYNEIQSSKKNIPGDYYNNVNNYRVESKEFKQIILNYAVLFKVLNYIKNQYIIQLQTNSNQYYKQIFMDQSTKHNLKTNVDKILLAKNNIKMLNNTINQSQQYSKVDKQNNQQTQNDIFNKIFKNILNSTGLVPTKPDNIAITNVNIVSRNDSSVDQSSMDSKKNNHKQKYRKQAKITFNSQICNQKYTDLSFLVRKVISKKYNPIVCIFYNQIMQKFVIYVTNYKKNYIKQIQIMVDEHSMPFINIINIIQNQSINQNEIDLDNNSIPNQSYISNINVNVRQQIHQNIENKKKKQRQFLLAFRTRLLRYHHNMILLTSP